MGLIAANPVSNSEPPVPKKHIGMALLPTEQMLMIESATGPACLPMLSAATGARRGEVLALRWSDINGNDVLIARSLTQTRQAWSSRAQKRTDQEESACLSRSCSPSKAIEKNKASSAGNLAPLTAPT
jgi:integrase